MTDGSLRHVLILYAGILQAHFPEMFPFPGTKKIIYPPPLPIPYILFVTLWNTGEYLFCIWSRDQTDIFVENRNFQDFEYRLRLFLECFIDEKNLGAAKFISFFAFNLEDKICPQNWRPKFKIHLLLLNITQFPHHLTSIVLTCCQKF